LEPTNIIAVADTQHTARTNATAVSVNTVIVPRTRKHTRKGWPSSRREIHSSTSKMVKRRLYRHPVESAKHDQFKKLCLDYFTHYDKLMSNPSMRHAIRARKALVLLKRVSHERGLELLSLYAPSQNEGKHIVNPFIYKDGRTTGKYIHTGVIQPLSEQKKE